MRPAEDRIRTRRRHDDLFDASTAEQVAAISRNQDSTGEGVEGALSSGGRREPDVLLADESPEGKCLGRCVFPSGGTQAAAADGRRYEPTTRTVLLLGGAMVIADGQPA